jgi:DNA primase
MTAVDEIKSRIDIVDLVSESVQLRRSGKNYTGFCPFHPNTRTPAFVVFPDSGTWRCFGQCNEGGDVFKFVMKKEGWDFPEALQYLAQKAGVELKPPTAEEQAAAEEGDALRALLEEAVTFYRHQLLHTQAGKGPLEYLREKRGLKDETIEAFGLGYAPDAWEALLGHFKSKGVGEPDLLAAGLITQREEGGGIYDRFRNRLTFPIRDERGRMAGFGARILNPEDVPKFLNSPQTQVFDKGRLLYGLDLAKRAIRQADQAVIVEGYLDVIALHQAGFANAVSPMGTALTERQLYLVKRYSKRIVLALDPDAAGDQATLRGLQVAREAMDHERDPVFDARGLLGYERRLKADIRVTTLPPGMDPDEVVGSDPQEWVRIVENAKPVVLHVMETLTAQRELSDPKVKSEIAAQVLPLIEDVANSVEREDYRQRLARLLRVDERALIGIMPTERGGGRRRARRAEAAPTPEGAPQIAAETSSYSLEAHCLGVLLRRPDLLNPVNRLLQEAGLERLSPQDFQHARHQDILRLFQESIEQDMAEPRDFVFNSLDLPMMELADSLLEHTAQVDPGDERELTELMRGLLRLRRRNLDQETEYQRFLMEEAQEKGEILPVQLTQTMVKLAEVQRKISLAEKRYPDRIRTRNL